MNRLFYPTSPQEGLSIKILLLTAALFAVALSPYGCKGGTKTPSAQIHNSLQDSLIAAQSVAADTVTISFIGDIMQHQMQINAALAAGGGNSYNYDNAFRFMEKDFKAADYMVANMEFTVGIKPYSGYPLFSAPPEIAAAAKQSGIDLFLMANNHIVDKFAKGLRSTIDRYNELGVATLGVYENREEAEQKSVLMVELKGMKFAFINYTYGTNGIEVPEPYYVNLQDSTEIKQNIARAKELGADMIIALPHWGEEYHLEPSAWQKRYAKLMFRSGVNAIIGSHPHVPEEAYIYTAPSANAPEDIAQDSVKRVVFYSLGNYISNITRTGYTLTGVFVSLKFTRDKLSQKVKMLMPDWKYIWCFTKGEYVEDFTVVPMAEFIGSEEFAAGGKTPLQQRAFQKMEATHKQLLQKDLVRVIRED